MTPRLAITLGRLNPKSWRDAALVADELGFDAVFVSDHLVAPAHAAGLLHGSDESRLVAPDTPLYDALGYCTYLAGITERVKLGTYVYLLGLRHPFVSARAAATLDQVCGGRTVLGVGAGWLTTEWQAAGVPPSERATRLEEAIQVCRRLWREDRIEHIGAHWAFPSVGFAPKPVQPNGIPIFVGGESGRALARAARIGDGWMGMGGATVADTAAKVDRLRTLRQEAGRQAEPFEITVGGEVRGPDDLTAWAAAGVDRLVVTPWRSSRTAVEDLRDFAAAVEMRAEPR
ncbi:TIGR03619 family F420-dependent LLM class oxidoreductase [Nocardia sp. NPDC052278]|uniref:TIGR03619 family F420-dependent LLM class oxidoreductase n=1 Tax=unclassified Nocardia TaxID=2637762 RepID=UPI003694C0B8